MLCILLSAARFIKCCVKIMMSLFLPRSSICLTDKPVFGSCVLHLAQACITCHVDAAAHCYGCQGSQPKPIHGPRIFSRSGEYNRMSSLFVIGLKMNWLVIRKRFCDILPKEPLSIWARQGQVLTLETGSRKEGCFVLQKKMMKNTIHLSTIYLFCSDQKRTINHHSCSHVSKRYSSWVRSELFFYALQLSNHCQIVK